MKALLAIIAIQIGLALWIGYLPSEPREPHEEACYRLEMVVKDAARCSAFPQAWEEWDRINLAYGNKTDRKGSTGCQILIKEVRSYGVFDDNEGRAIFQIIETAHQEETHVNDIVAQIQETTGADFCQVASRNGWIQSYTQVNPIKTSN